MSTDHLYATATNAVRIALEKYFTLYNFIWDLIY